MKKQAAATAQQEFLKHTQSTHGKTVEASAATLIILLRQRYTDEKKQELTVEDKKHLAALITNKTSHAPSSSHEEGIPFEEDRPSITGIVNFIRYITASDLTSGKRKQIDTVLNQIKKYISWEEDEWSKNRLFKAKAQTPEQPEAMIISASVIKT